MDYVTREEGHLLVAGIRVLAHANGTPPTADTLVELLGLPPETVRLKLEALREKGILVAVDSAYERHFEVADHTQLDDLVADAERAGMDEELAAFDRRRQEEQERMSQLFDDGEHEKKRRGRIKDMEEGLFKFEKGKPRNPFGDD